MKVKNIIHRQKLENFLFFLFVLLILLILFLPFLGVTVYKLLELFYKDAIYTSFVYEVCPEGIQPCSIRNRMIYWRRYKIQETSYTGQWHLSPLQSRCLGTLHSSPNCHQLPHHIFLNLIDSLKISSLSKVILVLGKNRSHRASNLGGKGAWVTWMIWCFTKISAWDMMHEWVCCRDEATNHQLPTAAAFWICRGMFKLNAKFDADVLPYSLILNATATQYTCALNSIYHPHWLVEWSHPCSCMHIPVHSPWLPCYINVMQTVLIILIMLDFFWTDLVIYHDTDKN